MKEYRSITYSVYPGTREKHHKMTDIAGANRYVWNAGLNYIQTEYDEYKKGNRAKPPSTTYFSLGKWFTQLRHQTPWLMDLPANPVKHSVKYLSTSYQEFFKGKAGYPNFKSKYKSNDGFTITNSDGKKLHERFSGNSVHIPRVGWVKYSGSNPHKNAIPKTARFFRKNNRWYMSVVYEVDIEKENNGEVLGIDMNVGQITDSDGIIYDMPDMSVLEAKKNRYQRMMSRRKKGSNRRGVARHRCAKTQAKIANKRNTWQHQVTHDVTDKASNVCIEDLQIKNMTKSAKGTIENPGTNVKQKSGLNKGILSTGWGGIGQKLEYKSSHVEKVHPAYTSQTCSSCGHTEKTNRKSQAEFECQNCGHEMNADHNAAINIRNLGLAQITARSTGASGRGRCVLVVAGSDPPGDISDPSTYCNQNVNSRL